MMASDARRCSCVAVNGSEDSRCEAGASKSVVGHTKEAVKLRDGETFKLN